MKLCGKFYFNVPFCSFPLPEVVVIHRDQECQKLSQGLESYILEELNVRTFTLADEDSRYGVRLQANQDS